MKIPARYDALFKASNRHPLLPDTMNEELPEPHTTLIHQESYHRCSCYLGELASGEKKPGVYLSQVLKGQSLTDLSTKEFLSFLINTKKPQIFTESSVRGDGSDWNQEELSILGDVAVAVPVTVYDNGLHHSPAVYGNPFSATLVYVPGTLLRNDTGNKPTDWDEIIRYGQIDYQAYSDLIERRLLPPLLFINSVLHKNHKQGLVTIPGIGCGQFAGKFIGQVGELLRRAILDILQRNISRIPHIKAIYFDPYGECENERLEISHLSFLVRPLLKGNENKPQLSEPVTYEEDGDDFANCELFSIVAWDHASWPGNDFYIGNRATDDGVKAAATSSMFTLTSIRGQYNSQTNTYEPPDSFGNWAEVIEVKKLQLDVLENIESFA